MLRQIYKLPYRERLKLQGRAYRAQQRNHAEVCGVLIVDERKRIELHFLKNRSDRPYHYEIDRKDIRNVKKDIASKNKKILGSFHSHPVSEPKPGPGDLKRGFLNGIELIYDVCGRDIKLWHLNKSGAKKKVDELPLTLESRTALRGKKTTRRGDIKFHRTYIVK